MSIKKLLVVFSIATVCLLPSFVKAQNNTPIIVQVNKPVAEIQPTMWGVFFEDINLGADGGIYAELVKNRSFEFYKPLMGWAVNQPKFKEGSVLIINRQETNIANPRFVRITKEAATDTLGLTNEGFRGMGIKKGLRYDFSVMYRQQTAGLTLHAELVSMAGKIIGTASLTPSATTGAAWVKAAISFNSTDSSLRGKLNIWFEGKGKIDLDIISLFPEDTLKKRPGGMRADMIQLLADMKPGFIRFPGGCVVEGYDLGLRYQWKKHWGQLKTAS